MYVKGTISSLESLSSRRALLPLPNSWIIANIRPLMLCKLCVQHDLISARADISMSLCVPDQLQWSLSLMNKQLDPGLCPLFSGVPPALYSAVTVCSLLRLLDSTKNMSWISRYTISGNLETTFTNSSRSLGK